MFGLIELLVIVIVVLGGIFWIWMLVDAAKNESDQGNTKIVWVGIIVLTGCIGAAIYFLARRSQRKAELGR